MSLQIGDIDHLAKLARISVKDEEKEEIANRIESVLSYVSEISKVDTTNYSHAEAGDNRNVLREDVALSTDEKIHDGILKNVPEMHGDYVKVQKMIG